jgi:hypothetical protein
METHLSTHPASDLLAAFGHGKLDNAAAKAVLTHLDSCDECRRHVAAQFGENFHRDFRLVCGKGSPVRSECI